MIVRFWRVYDHLGREADLIARVHRAHSRDLTTSRGAS